MATGARGEGIIELLDENGNVTDTVPVLYTNRALAEAESMTGKTTLQLLNAALRKDMAIGEVAQLLAVGMEAARKDSKTGSRTLNINDAYRVMDHVGVRGVAATVYLAITAVFAYDQEEQKSPNPPA